MLPSRTWSGGLRYELLNRSPLLIHDLENTIVQLIIGLELKELA
ncbi:hypothetical protein ACKUB1_11740 [Methanospirillum stamsii]|nr:hypothetical protein [Methanospirillum stamsii]